MPRTDQAARTASAVCGLVGKRNALQIVADLDVDEAEAACQVEESSMIEAGRDHVVERNLHVRNIHSRFG